MALLRFHTLCFSRCPEDSDVTANGSIAQEDECRIISPLSLEKEVLFSMSPHSAKHSLGQKGTIADFLFTTSVCFLVLHSNC